MEVTLSNAPDQSTQTARAKHVGAGAADNDNAPAFALTRAELLATIREAVTEAVLVAGRPRLVDKQELAQLLGCSPAHVDNLRKQGLPWVAVGMSVRFQPQEVIAWLREQSPGT